ncbi:Metallo-dependent phosphatase-like protein [Blakeslea trispora]|nr:Metallo-dependent phosphatase-like protein [Blakeslea trispora]
MMRHRLSSLLYLWSLLTVSTAYITDIKLVSCDANHACANYPGYRKIPTDLNKGVNGADTVYLHYKEDMTEAPITDLQIVQGLNDSYIPHLAKWTKLKVDLNQREHSDDASSLWLYYTKDTSISKSPVTSIIVKEGTSPSVSADYKRIPVDLNKDIGGYHLYMYYSQDGPKDPISSITAKECFTDNCYIEGWERVEKDLNKGIVVGMSVYLFYKRSKTDDPVTDVIVLLNDQTSPEGYTKIDVNLNSIFRGDAIHVWYRTTPSNPDVLRDAVQDLAIEFGKPSVTPYGWQKINVDLNSAGNGKESFGEPTYLFIRKGYKELPKMDQLAFNQDGSFKIVQFADLHFTNEEGNCRDMPANVECKGDIMTIEYMERLLDKEKPDLVVFSGDNIKGTGVSDARAATFKFVEPVIKRKIPWTAVFGTHDDEADLTREELLEIMRRLPYSMVQHGLLDLPGVGNYMLNIFESNHEKANPMFTLYFLDSHSYIEGSQEEYDYIKLEQLDWLVHSSLRSQTSAGKLSAAAFFHIPIWEYHEEDSTNPPVVKLGDAMESVSSPEKNSISAFESFKKGKNTFV